MHHPRSGTVVEFLDEFEPEAVAKFLFHKFTIVRQKAMAAEFERNRCPGWVQVISLHCIALSDCK
jgi:hypothetical protein